MSPMRGALAGACLAVLVLAIAACGGEKAPTERESPAASAPTDQAAAAESGAPVVDQAAPGAEFAQRLLAAADPPAAEQVIRDLAQAVGLRLLTPSGLSSAAAPPLIYRAPDFFVALWAQGLLRGDRWSLDDVAAYVAAAGVTLAARPPLAADLLALIRQGLALPAADLEPPDVVLLEFLHALGLGADPPFDLADPSLDPNTVHLSALEVTLLLASFTGRESAAAAAAPPDPSAPRLLLDLPHAAAPLSASLTASTLTFCGDLAELLQGTVLGSLIQTAVRGLGSWLLRAAAALGLPVGGIGAELLAGLNEWLMQSGYEIAITRKPPEPVHYGHGAPAAAALEATVTIGSNWPDEVLDCTALLGLDLADRGPQSGVPVDWTVTGGAEHVLQPQVSNTSGSDGRATANFQIRTDCNQGDELQQGQVQVEAVVQPRLSTAGRRLGDDVVRALRTALQPPRAAANFGVEWHPDALQPGAWSGTYDLRMDLHAEVVDEGVRGTVDGTIENTGSTNLTVADDCSLSGIDSGSVNGTLHIVLDVEGLHIEQDIRCSGSGDTALEGSAVLQGGLPRLRLAATPIQGSVTCSPGASAPYTEGGQLEILAERVSRAENGAVTGISGETWNNPLQAQIRESLAQVVEEAAAEGVALDIDLTGTWELTYGG